MVQFASYKYVRRKRKEDPCDRLGPGTRSYSTQRRPQKKKAGKTSDLRPATRGEIISDEQFLLLYDTLGSNNSDFPYGNCQLFSLFSTNSARSAKERLNLQVVQVVCNVFARL